MHRGPLAAHAHVHTRAPMLIVHVQSTAGVARFYKAKKNHVITVQTEHKCVLDSCRMLAQEGFDITYLPVQR